MRRLFVSLSPPSFSYLLFLFLFCEHFSDVLLFIQWDRVRSAAHTFHIIVLSTNFTTMPKRMTYKYCNKPIIYVIHIKAMNSLKLLQFRFTGGNVCPYSKQRKSLYFFFYLSFFNIFMGCTKLKLLLVLLLI